MTDTEKAALERRIDELCAEVERLHAEQVHWELGNCPSCPNVVSLQEALEQNAKLRELCADAMAALRVAEDELGRDVMVAHYPLLHIRMRELGVDA